LHPFLDHFVISQRIHQFLLYTIKQFKAAAAKLTWKIQSVSFTANRADQIYRKVFVNLPAKIVG
jgi:competence protein ComGF